jgi:vacuolar-type H+-ATPase subunit I/STV1
MTATRATINFMANCLGRMAAPLIHPFLTGLKNAEKSIREQKIEVSRKKASVKERMDTAKAIRRNSLQELIDYENKIHEYEQTSGKLDQAAIETMEAEARGLDAISTKHLHELCDLEKEYRSLEEEESRLNEKYLENSLCIDALERLSHPEPFRHYEMNATD